MDIICQILQNSPFFRHCSNNEITCLSNNGKIEIIRKGQKLDFRKRNSFGIVLNGILEVETPGKKNVIHLLPGSFIGDVPFTINKYQGYAKAAIDSTLALFDNELIYRFFLASYKGLKGYIKTIDRMGFEINEAGEGHLDVNSKIVTVYSSYSNCGKSIISSILGLSLSHYGNTIIVDSSYKGNSIFNIFGKEITPAISQKLFDQSSGDKLLKDKILKINENLSLINIASGSMVKVNPDIISPILFLLSKKYKYIIIDLSDYDQNLRDRIFCLSDIIFALIKKIKDRALLYDLFDSRLHEGQRVCYIINRYYAKDIGYFEGGYIFEDLEFNKDDSLFSNLNKHLKDDRINKFINIIVARRAGLVLETNLVESVYYAGFFSALSKADIDIDIVYSSSWGFIISSLFFLAGDQPEFEKNFFQLFSEEKINNFLDITFPDEYVFKNNKIYRFAREIAGDNRLEIYRTLPLVMLADEENHHRRIFSTGFFRDLLAASFLLYPIFESLKIAGKYYNSGYPLHRVNMEDLFRADIDEIIYVSVKNKQNLNFQNENLLKFYKRYNNYLYFGQQVVEIKGVADKNICIEVDEKKYDLKEIKGISEEISYQLLKEE